MHHNDSIGEGMTTKRSSKGRREHNLCDVDLTLPRGELICFSGVSGSGKSSLAFDTLFAEGQRRYVESLSNFARQFMGQMPKPNVDFVSGLSPTISISQKSSGSNPRSTVGTITEIYDFLRVLYARVGTGRCPKCNIKIDAQSKDAITARILDLPRDSTLWILAPKIRRQKGEFRDLFEDLRKPRFCPRQVDGETIRLSDPPLLDRQKRHDVEVVVDRIPPRLTEIVAEWWKRSAPLKDRRDHFICLGITTQRSKHRGWLRMTIFFHHAMPAANADRVTEPRRRNCSASIAPKACAEACMTGWDDSTRLSLTNWCRMIDFPSARVRLNFLVSGETSDGSDVKFIAEPRKPRPVAGLREEDDARKSKWKDLPEEARRIWLWGYDEPLAFNWRGGRKSRKFSGSFDGFIPELIEKYRTTRNKMQRKHLEKYMEPWTALTAMGNGLINKPLQL